MFQQGICWGKSVPLATWSCFIHDLRTPEKTERGWFGRFPPCTVNLLQSNNLHIPRFFSIFKSDTVVWHFYNPSLLFLWISWKRYHMRIGFTFTLSSTAKCCTFSNHGEYTLLIYLLLKTTLETKFKRWHSNWRFELEACIEVWDVKT